MAATKKTATRKMANRPVQALSAPGNPKIFIVQKNNGGIYALPGSQILASNGRITFQNFTDWVIDGQFSGMAGSPKFHLDAWTPGQPPPSAQVMLPGPQGYYQYTVKATKGTVIMPVQGNSDPDVIIDP